MTMSISNTQPSLFDFTVPEPELSPTVPSIHTHSAGFPAPATDIAPPPVVPVSAPTITPEPTASEASPPEPAPTARRPRGTRGQPSPETQQAYRRRDQKKALRDRLGALHTPSAQTARKPKPASPITLTVPKPTPLAEPTSLTLEDGYQHFLQQPQKKDPSKTNADLKPNQLGGFRRALLDFALGVSGATDLGQVPLSTLAREWTVVLGDLDRGAQQSRAQALDTKRLSNLRSDLKRLRDSLGDLLTLPGVAPKAGRQLKQERPKQHHLPAFQLEQFPARLRLQLDAVRKAYTDRNYAGPGHKYFAPKKLRRVSGAYLFNCLNQYVKYVVEEEQLDAPGLIDLVDEDRVLRFRQHYLALKEGRGGHDFFRRACTALAHVARYLEAIGELQSGYPPASEHEDAPWNVIVELGREQYNDGVTDRTKGHFDELPVVSPQELVQLGRTLQTLAPRTVDGRQPSTRQLMRRFFAAAFYLIGGAAPLRGRNWRGMRWGRNLRRDKKGRWEVHFEGAELKNGTYKRRIRTYKLLLPPGAVAALEWWIGVLKVYVGEDFQARCPFVFPMLSTLKDEDEEYRWVEMSHKYLLEAVDDACLEVRGHRFRPHHIRHCVATHIVEGGRVKDAQQAATLLGDTLSSVIKYYFTPNEQKLLDEGYYAEMERYYQA